VLAAARVLAASAEEGATSVVSALHEIQTREPELALAAVQALGRLSQPGSVEALVAIHETAPLKEIRKEAGRGLHRLRTAGVSLPASPVTMPRVPSVRARAAVYGVWATFPVGTGARELILVATRLPAGIWMIDLQLDEIKGLTSCEVYRTSRKRFAESVKPMLDRDVAYWAPLPVDYGAQLVGEALSLNQQRGTPIPEDYLVVREDVEGLERPFEGALICQTVSPGAARLAPDWLSRSPELLGELAIATWVIEKESLERFVPRWREATTTTPFLADRNRGARETLLEEAITATVTPALQVALKRRLEEAATCFLQTKRAHLAQWAAAAAVALEEATPSRLLVFGGGSRLQRHPFLRALVERSLDTAVEGSEDAGKAQPRAALWTPRSVLGS